MDYKALWPAIQADILGVIQADDFLGTRNGVLIEPGDIDSVVNTKIQKAVGIGLDGKNGVGFGVLPIEEADDDGPAIPGGPLKLRIHIQWWESVIINNSPTGTNTPIRVYAAQTEKILKLYTPVGLTMNLVPAKPVISEFTDNINKSLRVGMVEFTAVEADFKPFFKLNRPTITVTGANPVGGSYQLAGAALATVNAPGADVIYFTTDNSHPYQRNAAAQVYNQPVPITKPCLFRVRAFARGFTGSDTAAANFFE